ncbi:ABC transporter ATP-binding protein [Arcanobacterium hippocoleae]
MASDKQIKPLLQAQNLCIAIDSTEILHRLNFSISSGQFLAIRGANGSGKTTLLRAILNMLPVSSGKLEIFGKNAAQLNSHDWKKSGIHRST